MSDLVEVREVIPAALAGQRIDRVVALIADLSRNRAAELIAEAAVEVEGVAPSKPSERVDEGQVVVVRHRPETEGLEPDDSIELRLVHVDEHVVVVDKPAGLVVHPGAGTTTGTMAHALLHRFPEVAGVGAPERPGIVHRLDKGTSGLLVVARSPDALHGLRAQLVDRSMTRRYVTLVHGRLGSSEGVIDAPLGRSPRDPTRHAVVRSGREARTHYAVEERFDEPECTLLACRLETGRTHQIRVHLEAIEHPVVGDDRYGRAGAPTLGLSRPFLHAAELGFVHPIDGRELAFESPLPEDLIAVLGDLRRPVGDH